MVRIFRKLTKRIFLIIKLNEVKLKYWKDTKIVIMLEELKYKLITKRFFNEVNEKSENQKNILNRVRKRKIKEKEKI